MKMQHPWGHLLGVISSRANEIFLTKKEDLCVYAPVDNMKLLYICFFISVVTTFGSRVQLGALLMEISLYVNVIYC